ncbi:hypothetical protein cand_026760, partial [Cryptosporidium andersoni]
MYINKLLLNILFSFILYLSVSVAVNLRANNVGIQKVTVQSLTEVPYRTIEIRTPVDGLLIQQNIEELGLHSPGTAFVIMAEGDQYYKSTITTGKGNVSVNRIVEAGRNVYIQMFRDFEAVFIRNKKPGQRIFRNELLAVVRVRKTLPGEKPIINKLPRSVPTMYINSTSTELTLANTTTSEDLTAITTVTPEYNETKTDTYLDIETQSLNEEDDTKYGEFSNLSEFTSDSEGEVSDQNSNEGKFEIQTQDTNSLDSVKLKSGEVPSKYIEGPSLVIPEEDQMPLEDFGGPGPVIPEEDQMPLEDFGGPGPVIPEEDQIPLKDIGGPDPVIPEKDQIPLKDIGGP